MTTRTVTIEIPDTIEISNSTDFALWADRFGVEVGTRGRKPKAELVRAIRAYDGDVWPTTIVDTDYFAGHMGDEKGRESSPYGVELAKLRETREATIAAAHADFERARDALREKYGVETGKVAKPAGASAFVVSARTPMLDKETGEVQRTKPKGDKPAGIRFLPSPRKVELTLSQVRELTGSEGKRGRPSQADTLRAAVIAGEWFPVELMSTAGWESVLLRDAQVVPVEHAPETVESDETVDA